MRCAKVSGSPRCGFRLPREPFYRQGAILNGVGIVRLQPDGFIEVSQSVLEVAFQQIHKTASVVRSREIGLDANCLS